MTNNGTRTKIRRTSTAAINGTTITIATTAATARKTRTKRTWTERTRTRTTTKANKISETEQKGISHQKDNFQSTRDIGIE